MTARQAGTPSNAVGVGSLPTHPLPPPPNFNQASGTPRARYHNARGILLVIVEPRVKNVLPSSPSRCAQPTRSRARTVRPPSPPLPILEASISTLKSRVQITQYPSSQIDVLPYKQHAARLAFQFCAPSRIALRSRPLLDSNDVTWVCIRCQSVSASAR